MWFYGQYWAFRQFTRLCGCVPKIKLVQKRAEQLLWTNQSINQSIGPNFPRGQHATVAGWPEHDGNFDTVQTTLILVHWKLTTKLNVESYFWTWSFDLLVYLKYLAISDETWKHPIWIYLKYIIITITTIITRPGHNPKNHPQQNSRNWRFVLWSITSPLPPSWSAMSRGAVLRGPNLGTWRGLGISEVSGLGYGRVDSEWLKHSFFKHSVLALRF